MKNGFTLVELSIVLVIIGLLVGGILVGQALIQSAQINRFVRDVQQFDIAALQFRQKFKSYPGDSKLFEVKGNGDGIITGFTPGGEMCGTQTCMERHSYWKHLSDSGLLQTKYTNDWTGGLQLGKNTPKMAIGNSGLVAGYYSADGAGCSVMGQYASTGSTSATDGISGASAVAVDNKLDDGVNNTGNVESCTASVPCLPTDAKCTITLGMFNINYKL